MRVALSLVTLDPRIAGGVETYVRGLTRALHAGGRHDYHASVSWLVPDLADGLPTTVVRSFPARGPAGRARALLREATVGSPARGTLATADVVHYPVTVPLPRARKPAVVTLHDLQHHDLPHLFTPAKRVFRSLMYDRAVRNAQHVITISEWARRRAIDLLDLDPTRVTAVPLGVDHATFAPDPDAAESPAQAPFLYYPARPWPHKNHVRLLEAFALVRAEQPDLRLVLTGAGPKDSRWPEGVEALGDTPLAERVRLYQTASALVFPSLYEGFGLPPLEAMACGCPVAASDATAVPEICGKAAILFDPHDADAIAAAVLHTLADADRLRAAGLARAAEFSWERVATAHDDAYVHVASKS